MNPCEKHEHEDVDQHGAGFNCVYCERDAALAEGADMRKRLEKIANMRTGMNPDALAMQTVAMGAFIPASTRQSRLDELGITEEDIAETMPPGPER